MPISGHYVGTRRWRWRWRHPSHQGMSMAMALPSFSFLIRCNAVLMLAGALMLALHLLLRPYHPSPDPLLRSHSLETSRTRGSAMTWSTAGNEVKSPAVVLRNGVLMPWLGFGTAGLGKVTVRATSWALQAGYRLMDSAQATEWYNEKAVGRAIRSSSIRRDELFLVSKLHPRHLGYEVTKQQFNMSLQDLATSYLELFLLHYSRCFSAICGSSNSKGSWQESWKALEELHDELKIGAISVSNFNKEELQELIAYARIKPSVVQSNSDSFHPDVEIQQEGTQHLGYSTLGTHWVMRGYFANPVLNDPLIESVAVAQGCTSGQVVLRWALQKRQVVVPRSGNQLRIVENFQAQHCNLGTMQVAQRDDMYRHLPRLSTHVR